MWYPTFSIAHAGWPRQFHVVKVVLVVCSILAISVFMLSPEWTRSLTQLKPTLPNVDLSLHKHPSPQAPVDTVTVNDDNIVELPAKEPTKDAGKDAEPQPPKETTHLRKLCDNTTWTEGLWISCHSNCGTEGESICGGLNNARNRLQSCVRLAIDAGSGIVIPTMAVRNEKTLKPHDGTEQLCVRNLWDTAEMANILQQQCPQLQVRFCGNTTGLGPKIISHGTRHYNKRPHTTGTFRTNVKIDLKTHNITNISASNPVRIDYYDSMFSWNYTASNELETIRKDLFKVLPYNPDILQLGGQIFNLVSQYAPFVGIHLRGEGDWPHWFGTKEQQMDFYQKDLDALRESTNSNISDLYVSCGDQHSIQIFREKMEKLNYTVHDKWTLLADEPELLAKMENLTFDQKGILEYNTLTAADYFFGVGLSSMSLLVAFDRTVDEKQDYFSNFIHDNSTRITALNRKYPVSPIMKGNERTRLFMLSGPDIMDRYP